jgi:hypothetical protein
VVHVDEWVPGVSPLGAMTGGASHASMLQSDGASPLHRWSTPTMSEARHHSWCMCDPKGVHLAWQPGAQRKVWSQWRSWVTLHPCRSDSNSS